MTVHTIITLNEPQARLLDALAESIADRASHSPLPYTEYLTGLQRFVFAKTEDRVRLMKSSGVVYQTMIEDEGTLLHILALHRNNTLNFMTQILTILEREVKNKL